jgi:signal transduction histidine kinase
MKSRRKKFLSGDNRFRLILTLGLAVLLPAAALIVVNVYHLESIKRDKVLEAAIIGDFHSMLAISEKKINQKAYLMAEDARNLFPSPDVGTEEDRAKQLDLILQQSPWLTHVFLFDDEGEFIFQSQPRRMADPHFREEHEHVAKMYSGWFGMEGKMLVEEMHKKPRPITWYPSQMKRPGGYAFSTSAFFTLPQLSRERAVLGGVIFEPNYLKKTFFPEMFNELIARKMTDEGSKQLAMVVYPLNAEGGYGEKHLAASSGWQEGKPEVTRNLDNVFRGLALGIKYQGTSVQAIGESWVRHSFLILGILSVLMIGGLLLTYRNVSKEMALARLKSDFVSNVSHELRTPLALIRLYAETLELGRITTPEKKEEYYRIVRKESERLTALINNILDFSRIEAGRKEYDFRETNIAELVSNTLDSYRYQIEQQGFAFEQSIDPGLPAVRVDREAIARALVNLVNNALKYSANEKFLCVRLYRASGVLKLEVVDRGIGISRREQSKIFEKFYRTGDPLVHNTKGSGLGLSLVRHITNAHGGEVEVESTPGKGSKFTLSLPLTAAAQ